MLNRREVMTAATVAGLSAFATADERTGPVTARDSIKVTKLETFLVQPRWLFLKVHTNAGIVGLGEPIVEGRALTVAQAVKEIEPYLLGKDPRQVTHHWQAIYRHAFYRGGPVLTSALSGIDIALWDIKGKALGVPVYELLGGPTRSKVRVFREVLEKKAATVLQPDLCHAGGITEVRLIAGMAETYYAAIAPHNPLGPISLAAW